MMIENTTQSVYNFQNITNNQNFKNAHKDIHEIIPPQQSLDIKNTVSSEPNMLLKQRNVERFVKSDISFTSTKNIMDIHTKLDTNKDSNTASTKKGIETYKQQETKASSSSTEAPDVADKLEELYKKLAEIQKQIRALSAKFQGASDEQKMVLNEQLNALNTQLATVLAQIMTLLKAEENSITS